MTINTRRLEGQGINSEGFAAASGAGILLLLLAYTAITDRLPDSWRVAAGLVPDGKGVPTTLRFTAPTINKWSDIHFRQGIEDWSVNADSVSIIAQSGNSQLWDAEIEDQNGRTARVACTSGTIFPTKGGSYFEADCTTN